MLKQLLVTAALFAGVAAHSQLSTDTLIPFRLHNKWGYADLRGNMIVPATYDSAYTFEPSYAEDGVFNSLAAVKKGARIGLINEKGALVTPCIYDEAWHYKREFHVFIGKDHGIVNSQGKLVIHPGAYKEIDIQPYGYEAINGKGETIYFDKTGKRVNRFGTTDTPVIKTPKNREVTPDKNGYGRQLVENGKVGYLYRKQNANMEWVDVILPAVYDSLFTPGSFPEICVVKKDGAWGAVTVKGEVTVPFEYESVQPYAGFINYNGSALVRKNGKWGIVNLRAGTIDLPCEYDDLQTHQGTNGSFVMTHCGKMRGAAVYNYYRNKISIIECRYLWFNDILKYKGRIFLLAENTNRRLGLVGEDGVEYFKD